MLIFPYSLVGEKSIIGQTLFIYSLNATSEANSNDAIKACAVIQSEDQADIVRSAKVTLIDTSEDHVKGQLSLVQEGPQDFVHITGTLFDLDQLDRR